jgi:hypothetical protein
MVASIAVTSGCHKDRANSPVTAQENDPAARCLVMMTNLYLRDPNGSRANAFSTAAMFYYGHIAARYQTEDQIRPVINQATKYLNGQPTSKTDSMREECVDLATSKVALIAKASGEDAGTSAR